METVNSELRNIVMHEGSARGLRKRAVMIGSGLFPKPTRLAKKLLQIRNALGLSQNQLIGKLGLTKELTQHEISEFERGTREPSVTLLLAYGQAAGVWVDVLIDDELDLPKKLPSYPKHEGVNRKPTIGNETQN